MSHRVLVILGVIGLLCPIFSVSAKESAVDIWPVAASGVTKDPEVEARVATILSSMTLEEKVGQMIQAELQFVTPSEAAKYGLGSILNGGGSTPDRDKRALPTRWREVAAEFDTAMRSRSGVAIPLLWGTDAVHGHNNVFGATIFPHNIGIGASRDVDLLRRIATATAREVRATGIHWAFAPTLAVARDLRWGRTYESFSSDSEIVRQFAYDYVVGLQGDPGSSDFLSSKRVIATAKHFIADGGTTAGIDQGNTELDDADLARIHAPGYYAAIAAGVQTVMVSFSSVNGEKLHGHRRLLTDVLKNRLGFDGLIVSDWNGIGQVPGCTNSSCPQAVNAGIDMIMAPEDWRELHRNIVSQVKTGLIPTSRIDDAVTRILRVKARYGMLQADPRYSDPNATPDVGVIGSDEHRALAREAVRKSLVLIKNQNKTLPLKPTARVAVVGAAANDVGRQSGGWTLTWQGTGNEPSDFPGATSIFEGIQNALSLSGGSAVLGMPVDSTQKLDALIVVVGEEPYAEGEGDLQSLEYAVDAVTKQAIEASRSQGVPVVTLFVSGRPRLVNPLINRSDAFVAAWLPGSEGAGVADVLIARPDGSVNADFQGRLPFEWPLDYTLEESDEVEVRHRPLPIGWGLTYATETSTSVTSLPEPVARSNDDNLQLRIFDRRPVPPNQMFIGDRGNWRVPVTGPDASSSEGIVTVRTIDRARQGDARQLDWNGRGEGIVYFETTTPRDLREWTSKGSALAMDIKVLRPPTRSTFMRSHCVYPCGAQANVTPILRKAPPDEWVRVSIDMSCFVKSGLDPSKVTTIPLLSTNGQLSMSISNIRLIPDAAQTATISCADR
ncbi:MAG: glycoside hydrolase family 3 protein [Steroidobacteraceae bacterium]